MKINMHAVHFSADKKLTEFIDKKLSKLETFFDRIIGADVFLKLENHGTVKDKVAEIKIAVPGGVLVVKEQAQTFEAAIDEAMDTLKRMLIRFKEKDRRAA